MHSYHLHGSGIQRIYARLCEMLDRSMEEADGYPQAQIGENGPWLGREKSVLFKSYKS